MIFLTGSFAINNIYLYDSKAFIKKNVVFNKIVPDFMDTLYVLLHPCMIKVNRIKNYQQQFYFVINASKTFKYFLRLSLSDLRSMKNINIL